MALLLALGYFAAAIVSITLSRVGQDVAGLWCANALAFVLLARRPDLPVLPAYAGIAVASIAANLTGGSSLAAALLFSVTNVANIALSLWLVRRYAPRVTYPPAVRDFTAIFLLVACVASLVTGAIFGIAASALFGWPLAPTAWTWAVANALGLALVLPPGLSGSAEAMARLRGAARLRLAGISLLCSAVAWLALSQGPFPFALAMLPLLVAAVHMRTFELGVVCAVTGVSILLCAIAGDIPGLAGGAETFSDGFQLAVAITVAMPFLGGLLVKQLDADRRRIAESEQQFRRAMEDSAIGVCIVALDGRIAKANLSFAAMLGEARERIEGGTDFELTHPDDRARVDATLRQILTGNLDSYRFERRYLKKDGTPVWTQVSGSVIRDTETGAPLHLVSQIVDIDARKKSEAAIAEAETRWNFALAAAGQGIWDLDMRRGSVTYSSTWKKMLGYDGDELDGDPDCWLTLVHPDDLGRVTAADHDHFDGRTPFFESEFRMRHRDGHWVWILDRGKAIERDAEGRLVRAIGSLTDITLRKQAEERVVVAAKMLADEKERLRVTLQSIGDAVICTDATNRVTFMNSVAEKLTGVTAAATLGKPLGRVYRIVDEETGEKLRLPRAAEKHPARIDQNSRAALVRRDGTRCSIRQVVSPIINDRDEFCGSVFVFQDFTDARTLQRELAYAATHDALTGLANRSSFIRTVEALSAECDQGGAEHQFLFIDLDNFKAVNDTGGHAAGDELLKAVGVALRAAVRAGDAVARLGGDEFAVVPKFCSPEAGKAIAKSLVTAIAALGTAVDGKIGASIGITSIGFGSGAADEVIARADQACYRAKAAGRGCVVALSAQKADGDSKQTVRAAS